MTNTITPRYGLTYRQSEITLICEAAKSGQSLCFVGIAGTGKSNITNFLHSDPYSYKPHYLGKETGSIHFPVIDGNTWDQTPEGLWKQLLAALTETTQHLPQPPADAKITQLYQDQKALSDLKARVNWLCQEQKQQIMFILDDFDRILQLGPLPMLEQFNALRSENRGQLSYLIFTKKLPHVLGRNHELKGNSKFYDLFSNHIYALGLYDHEDARQMLTYLNESAGKPLGARELPIIEKLTGGHARLIKVIFELWRGTPPESADFVAYFLEKNDVRDECQRVLRGLHPSEQEVALRVAREEETTADQEVIDHLMRRGLLSNPGKLEWFSPVFAAFLRGYTG